MTHARFLYILLIALLSAVPLLAQNDNHTQLLEQADENYELGQFDQALELLLSNIGNMHTADKQKALRLIALCYLAQDKEAEAERYASQLIELNNFYNSVNDPIRFEDMVNRLKAGHITTITTASSVSETINEAPVPVTIITSEMIESLGYNKRLGQILATFVPGMAEVSTGQEDNMSMHGAFNVYQELMLVMENGHRLNNRFINSYSMDYAISTEKIERIEVLRGPASSLYGNVALSAVVNIITKSGKDVDGVKAKYGYGSFNTHKADLVAGTRFMDADILVWGSFYRSDGQLIPARDAKEYNNHFLTEINPKFNAFVDAYKDTPSYDIGMSFKYKGFDIMFSRKNSKKLTQYGSMGYYDYDKYRSMDGIMPGKGIEENHVEIGYTRMLGNVTLNASAYGDWYAHHFYEAAGDESVKEPDDESMLYGLYDYGKFKEGTMGSNLRASTNYSLGGMKGNFLIGAQYEHFRLTEMSFVSGSSYTGVFSEPPFLTKDVKAAENSLSFYAQGKHNFTSKLILNAGIRYDIKHRFEQDNVKAVSPRLALIYSPKTDFSMKLTYAKSFVDMSYYYRSMQNYFIDSEYLPQYLTAIQFNLMGRIEPWHLSYDVNLVYNKYENLYFQSYQATGNRWENEGMYENFGVEASLMYKQSRLMALLNFYWCKDWKADNYFYSEAEHRVLSVPHLTANLNVGYQLIKHKMHALKIYGNAKYEGSKLMNSHYTEDGTSLQEKYLDKTVIFDLGAKYIFNGRLQLAVDCENILDTKRYLTGADFNMYPYRQRGRNLIASIAYTF